MDMINMTLELGKNMGKEFMPDYQDMVEKAVEVFGKRKAKNQKSKGREAEDGKETKDRGEQLREERNFQEKFKENMNKLSAKMNEKAQAIKRDAQDFSRGAYEGVRNKDIETMMNLTNILLSGAVITASIAAQKASGFDGMIREQNRMANALAVFNMAHATKQVVMKGREYRQSRRPEDRENLNAAMQS